MKQRTVLVALALGALTFALYLPTARNGFINLDDERFITANDNVLRGLNARSAHWAFTTTENANWYPLTRLAHLADVSFFGMWAGGHHLLSALWHAVAAALLCGALAMMTGALWRSFVVAGLFAAHPLQVESVAWAAERSNVLAGFFFALTLLLWVRYARRPGPWRYAAALAAFALGLMAKPVLVPLPLLLLLLDLWPLGRLGRIAGSLSRPAAAAGRLLIEKAPLLGLAVLSSAVTLLTQEKAGAIQTDSLAVPARFGNAALSYVAYLRKLFWPMDLAVYYPHPGQSLSPVAVTAAGLFLAALTAGFVLQGRRRPWLGVGWLWFAGMLVPMIGIVQVGSQAMADRYAYLPAVGIFVALVWSCAEFSPLKGRRPVLAAAAAAVLILAGATTVVYGARWRDSLTILAHTLTLTRDNWVVENDLGLALAAAGRYEEAVSHYREAVRIRPADARLRNNFGVSLINLRRLDQATVQLQESLRLDPDYFKAHNNLGIVLYERGDYDAAAASCAAALRLKPDYPEAHNNLGNALLRLGRPAAAAAQYREALRLRPGFAEARANLGLALSR